MHAPHSSAVPRMSDEGVLGFMKSGLRDAIEVLRGVDGISFTFFTAKDVVRHPLVQRIVRAYESREAGDVKRDPDADGAKK